MKDIDKLLQRNNIDDVKIPSSVENKIQYALNHLENRSNKINYIKRIITVFISTVLALIGSVTVYATFGGTISGKPIIEWLGIKFSDEYEEYKMDVEGQEVIYNETKIDLASTVCDDGFVIFEFDIKLSKEDKEYLRLGKPLVSEEELKVAEEEALREQQGHEKNNTVGWGDYSATGRYEFLQQGIELVNTVQMIINDDLLGANYAKYNILIDGEGYYTKSTQTVTKISDYEYKVYQLYFLTDEILKGKTDFSVTLRLNAIENTADKSGYKKIENNSKLYLSNTPENQRRIDMTGEFVANVSKNQALENTKVIHLNFESEKYRNMTKTVEEVRITPLQIIAKVKTHIDNVSLQSLTSTRNKNYIGITDFDVYDNLGNKLESLKYETKRTITYADGKVEEWATGDIGTYKSFYNAQMDLIEYIIVEKKDDLDSIKIVPTVNIFTDDNFEEKTVELDALEINLKQ